ncbi:MAG TPA: EAL domain-containing protein [Rhizobium sp.]
MRQSRLEISIENLRHIEVAYSEGAAGRVLYEVWSRFEAALTSEIWQVTTEPWGVSLQFSESHGDVWGELEAALHAVALRPVKVDGVGIVVGLYCGAHRPEDWGGLASMFDLSRYRSDMQAVAAAYSALADGWTLFAEQVVTDAAEPPVTLYRECLLRLSDEDGQLLMPADYIPAMERLGLTRAFDRQIVGKVLAELCRRPGDALGCNLSALSATKDLWWHSLLSELALDRDLASRLVIEITETAMPSSIQQAAAFVAAIRATGARIAIDDYGTGFSSASFTQRGCVDIVKIDGSFVGLSASQGEAALRHLVLQANVLGQDVVIEGVETEADLQVARRAGARWFQGYFVGKPVCSAMMLAEQWPEPEPGQIGGVRIQ